MLTFYHYSRCMTCVKAQKYLTSRGFQLHEIDITTNPPSEKQLTALIKKSGRPYTDFLNRSGIQYREQKMKEKVGHLSEREIVALLAENGRLIKRPIVTEGEKVTVGFNPDDFSRVWVR